MNRSILEVGTDLSVISAGLTKLWRREGLVSIISPSSIDVI